MLKSSKYRLFLVDDHPVVRHGMTQFINDEDDLVVCGDAESISKAITGINRVMPDLVITDITLEDGSGLDLVAEIKSRFNIPVLVLSMHDEEFYAERALRAGAKGYIMKQEPMTSVVEAVHEILKGGIYLNPRIKDLLLSRLLSPGEMSGSIVDKLSNREIEVLKNIGNGQSNRHIAEQTGLSVRTVETYRRRIIEKLCLSGSEELVQFAVEWRKNEGKNL